MLADVLARSNCFNDSTRQAAFNFVRRRPTEELIGLVKDIARMDIHVGDDVEAQPEQVGDALAVSHALSCLSLLNDPEAVEFSTRRLGEVTPFVWTTALINLSAMGAWDATSQVEETLEGIRVQPDLCVEIDKALRFLISSPQTSRASCTAVARIKTEGWPFAKSLYCRDLAKLASEIETKVGCPVR